MRSLISKVWTDRKNEVSLQFINKQKKYKLKFKQIRL
jgi:hypothetical protein